MLYTERSWKALIDIGYLLGAEGGLAAHHCTVSFNQLAAANPVH